MLPLIRADFAKNFNFCGIDFGGCGLSEGNTISYGINEADDIDAVVSYLRTKYRIIDLHLWGRSMGAVAAILYC
jgi:pimeloyl-ACP methyl ester carboxylesterase